MTPPIFRWCKCFTADFQKACLSLKKSPITIPFNIFLSTRCCLIPPMPRTAILDMWSSSPEAKHIAIFFKAIPGTTRLQERNLSFVGMAGSFTSTSIGRVEKYWVNDRSSSLDMLASPVTPLEEEDDEAWCPRSPPSCFEPAAAQGCGSDPAGSFGGTGSFGSVFWTSFSMMERCFRSPDWAALGPSDFWRPKFSIYIITWCSNCQMFNLLTAVSRFYSCSVGTSQDILWHASVG